MQASLPKLVRMVCVEDLGQGSDPLRILGVRWLPKGAASHEVNQEGKLEGVKKGARKHDGTKQDQPGTNDLTKTKANEEEKEANEDASKDANERTDGNEDEQHGSEGQDPSADGGMKPETGDFINLQVAFAYRATHSRKAFKDRAKHAHLYLAFYLPGNIKIRKSTQRQEMWLFPSIESCLQYNLLILSQPSGLNFAVSSAQQECAYNSRLTPPSFN